MELTPGTQKQLLEELAEWLQFEDCQPVEWVVCGGVALALQGLQVRTTQDVDVLGEWDGAGGRIICIREFPDEVRTCIQRVIENHRELDGFDRSWINLGPAQVAEVGLPSGFETRMKALRFGSTLTLHLLGREDLIALKLYAAADEHCDRKDTHLNDLQVLDPTELELDKAIEWVRTRPNFEPLIRQELRHIVRDLGHEGLGYYV